MMMVGVVPNILAVNEKKKGNGNRVCRLMQTENEKLIYEKDSLCVMTHII